MKLAIYAAIFLVIGYVVYHVAKQQNQTAKPPVSTTPPIDENPKPPTEASQPGGAGNIFA